MKTVKSIELPDVKYKLTKLGSLNKNTTMIDKGMSVIGPLHLEHILLGQSVAVGRLGNSFYTTEVTKIILKRNKVIFHTLNSIYELVEVND